MLTDTVPIVLLHPREIISYSRLGESQKQTVIYIALSLVPSTVPWNSSPHVD